MSEPGGDERDAEGGAVAVDDPPVPLEGDALAGDRGGDAVGPVGSDGSDPPAPVPLADELARVTGLLLVVLLPIHLVTVLLADPTEVDRLLDRWEDQWWLLADWGFLTVGLSHCLLSLRGRMRSLGSRGLSAPDDRFGIVAYRLLVVLTVGLYLAASWAMLRLV